MFHFTGHWLVRGDEMFETIRRVTGDPAIALKPFPFPVLYALSPFVEMFRELLEIRYLWEKPIGLEDAKLRAFLGGAVPTTLYDDAIRESLADMGFLPDPGARAAGGIRLVAA